MTLPERALAVIQVNNDLKPEQSGQYMRSSQIIS